PLRTKLSGSETFIELVTNIRELTLSAFEHQFYPLDKLVDELNVQRDLSRNPLFDVVVVLQNNDLSYSFNPSYSESSSLSVTSFSPESTTSKFDLTFNFTEQDNRFLLIIEYSTDLFTRRFVEQMAAHFKRLTELIGNDPYEKIGQID